MTEPMDDFERRLADGLRAFTDDAPRRADYGAEARRIVDAATPRPRRRLAPLFGAVTVIAAVIVALVVVSVAPLGRGPARAAPTASSSQLAWTSDFRERLCRILEEAPRVVETANAEIERAVAAERWGAVVRHVETAQRELQVIGAERPRSFEWPPATALLTSAEQVVQDWWGSFGAWRFTAHMADEGRDRGEVEADVADARAAVAAVTDRFRTETLGEYHALEAAHGFRCAGLTAAASAPPAASTAPSPAPEPSALPTAEEIDLAAIAWYEVMRIDFGVVTGPAPTAAPSQTPYTQLRVGTLDGRVAASLRLAQDTFASGPFGMDVLVGQDDGSESHLMLVSAVDGSTRELFSTTDKVVRASLSPDGEWVYYVSVDRAGGTDMGLWRLSIADGTLTRVFDGPISAEPQDYTSAWQMEWSSTGDYLVVQACSPCRQLVHRPSDGMSRMDVDRALDLIGVAEAEYVVSLGRGTRGAAVVDLASGERREMGNLPEVGVLVSAGEEMYIVHEVQGLEVRAYRLVSVSVADGSERVLLDLPATQPTDARITNVNQMRAGVPAGWVLRWPPSVIPYSDTGIPPHVWYAGELVNAATGERLRVPPFANATGFADCAPIAPRELPSGADPGDPIESYGGPFRWATWGTGTDQVVQVIGGWPYGGPGTPNSTPVTIRGHAAGASLQGGEDGGITIAWEEAGCRYEVRLPPGTTLEQATEYASRY